MTLGLNVHLLVYPVFRHVTYAILAPKTSDVHIGGSFRIEYP